MKELSTDQIREIFLDFFQEKEHTLVDSSSLIPHNDPSLLFTNAGMVPFKDLLLGVEKRDYSRAVSSQRCLRVGGKHDDLDNVGYTARHHTFFEMLGNFSFGDYFKEEAIEFAWELLTQRYEIPAEKLWITVHKDDEESESIWIEKIGIDPDRISRLDDDENFWTMGDTGPCGPCSEIYYDHGDDIQGEPPEIGSDPGDRFIEIWNLVFTQFDRSKDGSLSPLPNPCVDTGMGLERMASVLQKKQNNFNTDSFLSLIKAASKLTKLNENENSSLRVIVDHLRASSFLIAEGITPSNEGRGYVLRRIIRRALRHGNKLGHKGPLLSVLASKLVEDMGQAHPLLIKNLKIIEANLLQEEEQFESTLSQGMSLLEEEIKQLEGKEIPGELVFKLYDTYGFPVDMTSDFARENDLFIDLKGYEELMLEQKKRARSSSSFSSVLTESISISGKTNFVGYEDSYSDSKILAISNSSEQKKGDTLSAGQEGIIFLDKTPFYAESGGQVGDKGRITNDEFSFIVSDTQKIGDHFGHVGEVEKGSFARGDEVEARIDENLRKRIVLNHSATHLLHASLRRVLGEHVEQKGSLVDVHKLRFDFSHPKPLSKEELIKIEDLINKEVLKDSKTKVQTMTMDQAIKEGAIAFFGDKYGDEVRVLNIGKGFSVELCGGTHVKTSSDIGLVKVISESGISAGVRRIEAVSGKATDELLLALTKEYTEILGELEVKSSSSNKKEGIDLIRYVQQELSILANELSSSNEDVISKIQQIAKENSTLREVLNLAKTSSANSEPLNALKELKKENKELKAEKDKLESKDIGLTVEELIKEAIDISGYKVITKKFEDLDASSIRETADKLRKSVDNSIIVLVSIHGDKLPIIVACSKDLEIDARVILENLTNQLGGSGGGRSDFVQGGIENIEDIEIVLSSIPDFILSLSA